VARHRHYGAHAGPCHSSQLHWWICHAEQVLRARGTPRSAISTAAAFIVVWHESGGNPHAYNGWDSNAAAGTPSEGIAQVIRPTFSAYRLPGHGNIWNPVDNMIAAFRYAISRYGSMNNIPGVVAVRSGGSYSGY
jgi:SLT domain-containing protein